MKKVIIPLLAASFLGAGCGAGRGPTVSLESWKEDKLNGPREILSETEHQDVGGKQCKIFSFIDRHGNLIVDVHNAPGKRPFTGTSSNQPITGFDLTKRLGGSEITRLGIGEADYVLEGSVSSNIVYIAKRGPTFSLYNKRGELLESETSVLHNYSSGVLARRKISFD